jgi:hydroxymethylpyrimidine/phosphomethylpyrimidine kinase
MTSLKRSNVPANILQGRLLIIAGSDSGGGAGIQADIKTASAFNTYSMTAITALTAQNTTGVKAIHPAPAAFIKEQMLCCLEDIGADAIKTGMLHNAEAILAVVEVLESHAVDIPLVVDPVMIAKGGAALLKEDAIEALKTKLIPLATLITPNIPEAEVLSGQTIKTVEDMEQVANALLTLGAQAVLVKGGHLAGDVVTNVLATKEAIDAFSHPRINTQNTHGTGCTLASAIAAQLAKNIPIKQSVTQAETYVQHAIASAPDFGKGHGPLNHSAST